MRKSPLRVTIITRRHLVAVLFFIALAVGIVRGLDARGNPNDAPTMLHLPAAGTKIPISNEKPLRQVAGAGKLMALTINVDWGNPELEKILEVLDHYGVRATFFLTGRWAKKYPDLARRIALAGHEVGNHGVKHDHPTRLSQGALATHIGANVDILKETTGKTPVPLYAPPYGEENQTVVKEAARLGQWTILWTLDTIDWQNPAPATIVERIVPRAAEGAIVLMHPKPQTLEALPRIIEGLRSKGYRLLPVYEMMKAAS